MLPKFSEVDKIEGEADIFLKIMITRIFWQVFLISPQFMLSIKPFIFYYHIQNKPQNYIPKRKQKFNPIAILQKQKAVIFHLLFLKFVNP